MAKCISSSTFIYARDMKDETYYIPSLAYALMAGDFDRHFAADEAGYYDPDNNVFHKGHAVDIMLHRSYDREAGKGMMQHMDEFVPCATMQEAMEMLDGLYQGKGHGDNDYIVMGVRTGNMSEESIVLTFFWIK